MSLHKNIITTKEILNNYKDITFVHILNSPFGSFFFGVKNCHLVTRKSNVIHITNLKENIFDIIVFR
jgi:hypothetical protein